MALAHIFTLAQLANALALASLLTLLATGLALVFGLRDVMNFAHGALFMFGAYLAYSVSGLFGFWAALIVVPIALGLVGVLFEYAAFRPLRHRPQMDVALLTFGFALVISQIVIKIWGASPLALGPPPLLAGSTDLFGRPYPTYRLFLIVVGFAACGALALWLRYTRLGMHVRAVSRSPQISRILGVNTDRLGLLVVAMGLAYAGFAGVLAGPYLAIDPALGANILISCLIVVVVGGLGSIGGAIAAALVYGFVEVFGSMASPVLAVTAPYLLLFIVLLWRPQGFGNGRVD
jgi:branched-chain amino acid transport system permease protein